VGDLLLLHPISAQMVDPSSAGVLERIQRADGAIANFEVSAFDRAAFDFIPQSESGGLWLNAGPDGVADTKALGFAMVSRANNHATDFGTLGMEETDRLLDRHQIIHAGTGAHLGEARAPAYLTTRSGRIALISATCTFTRLSMAAYARLDMRGRPGVNYIRSRRVKVVDAITFNTLVTALHVARERGAEIGQFSYNPDTIRRLGADIEKGLTCHERYILDNGDVEANLAQVRAARRRADYVVFALHTHLPHNGSDVVPDAIREFAHHAIDAGTDVVLGHGAHRFKAVEIYKGRPIFYDLANFVCHAPKASHQPTDSYAAAGLGEVTSAIDDLFAEGGNWATEVSSQNWWEGAIVQVIFEDCKPKTVELYPVDLCQNDTGSRLGTPRLADAALSARLLERIATLSQPYGTTIDVSQGIGTIVCEDSGLASLKPDVVRAFDS
jgi:poly-gamma-glutamate capsule biosynthesis protein CapA/YwtB (metallophosphatase superfamily)